MSNNIRKWHELGPFTVFDIETTGMSPAYDRIVEIAAARIELDGSIERYQSLVNPGCPIPAQAMNIHRITDEMVCKSPHFHDIANKFLSFIEGSTLVAHNARFDLGFLQESLARGGFQLWQGNTMDTLTLIRKTHSGLPSYSLQNLRKAFALKDTAKNMQAHRASADVEWTMQVLEISLSELLRIQDK